MINFYKQQMEEALELARRYERCPEDQQKAAGAKKAREDAEFYRKLMEEAIAEETNNNNNNEKENEEMNNTNINLTDNTASFTHNGITYRMNLETNRYSKVAEGIKGSRVRIGKAEYEAAKAAKMHEALEELNKKQNEKNEFVEITPEDIEREARELEKYLQEKELEDLIAETEESNNDLAGEEIAAEMAALDDMAENPEVSLEEFVEEVQKVEKKAKKTRKSKDVAFSYCPNGTDSVTLTAKQVDFIKHLPDTCFWEHGLDSCIWTDVLADEIGGQFAGKPMTTGAMISTLCEKGLAVRSKMRVNGKKCTSFELTDMGKQVAAELGLN